MVNDFVPAELYPGRSGTYVPLGDLRMLTWFPAAHSVSMKSLRTRKVPWTRKVPLWLAMRSGGRLVLLPDEQREFNARLAKTMEDATEMTEVLSRVVSMCADRFVYADLPRWLLRRKGVAGMSPSVGLSPIAPERQDLITRATLVAVAGMRTGREPEIILPRRFA